MIDILTSYIAAKATPEERPEPGRLDAVPRYALDDMTPPRVVPDVQAVLAALSRLRAASGEVGPLDLSRVDLRGVRLNRVDLTGTDLTDSWLDDASLREATFAGAQLRRAFLTKVDLSEANLDRASMEGIDLRGALAWRASMRSANLGPSPHWTGPRGPDERYADLESTDLGGADLTEATLYGANVQFASFRGAVLRRAVLSGIHGEQSIFREADLTGAGLQRARLIGTTFHKAILAEGNLADAEINGWLSEADLRRADLRRGDFSGSNFKDARLHGADLRGAYLVDTVDLTWDQLREAIIDDTTILPDNLAGVDDLGTNRHSGTSQSAGRPAARRTGAPAKERSRQRCAETLRPPERQVRRSVSARRSSPPTFRSSRKGGRLAQGAPSGTKDAAS